MQRIESFFNLKGEIYLGCCHLLKKKVWAFVLIRGFHFSVWIWASTGNPCIVYKGKILNCILWWSSTLNKIIRNFCLINYYFHKTSNTISRIGSSNYARLFAYVYKDARERTHLFLPLDSENPYDDTLLSLSKVSSNLQNTDSRSSSEELVTLSSKEKAPAHPFKEVCPTTPVTQP